MMRVAIDADALPEISSRTVVRQKATAFFSAENRTILRSGIVKYCFIEYSLIFLRLIMIINHIQRLCLSDDTVDRLMLGGINIA